MLNFSDVEAPDLAGGWLSLKATKGLSNTSDRDKFYQGSYRFILSHFSTCTFDGSRADCDRFWQALILVYSWMGRGLLTNFESHFERYSSACGMIRSIRDTGRIDLETLNHLIELCDGSTIATSKFLHFLRPDAFAIWDSRVCAAIFEKKRDHSWVSKPRHLLAYLEWIRGLKLDQATLLDVSTYLGIDAGIGALRAKEFILFMSGAGQVGQTTSD